MTDWGLSLKLLLQTSEEGLIVRTKFWILRSLHRFLQKFEGLEGIAIQHYGRTVDHVTPEVGWFAITLTEVEESYLGRHILVVASATEASGERGAASRPPFKLASKAF